MGLGGISIWQLLIVLGIVVMIFGTKKLRSLGGDLGGAVKGFKNAMKEGESQAAAEAQQANLANTSAADKNATATNSANNKESVIDVTATQVKDTHKA